MLTTRSTGVRRLAIVGTVAVLFACGGGGGGESAPAGPPPSKAFAADSGHFAIGSVINPNPPPGPLVVDRIIQGASTGLSNNIGSFALDGNDHLYVGNGVSIRVFNGASFADGNVAPARVITNNPFGGNTGSLFLDTLNNRLYVGDDAVGVRVFNNASGISGAIASDRLITGFGTVLGVAVDTDPMKNVLYVSNRTSSAVYQISVFDGADGVNGAASAARIITPHFNNLDFPVGGMFLDAAHDRLYVAGGTNFLVMVFEGASTADGPTAPAKVLSFPINGPGLKNVVVDTANDRLYAVSTNSIYALSNVSTASGPVTGTAVLAPPGGSFTAIAVSP